MSDPENFSHAAPIRPIDPETQQLLEGIRANYPVSVFAECARAVIWAASNPEAIDSPQAISLVSAPLPEGE